MTQLAPTLAAVGSGLVAGLCFAFGSFLLRSFDRLGPSQAIRTMQSINATILQSTSMWVWMATPILGVVATAFAVERGRPMAALVSYVAGALLITRLRNIPLNEELDRVNPDAPGAEEAWRSYRVRWGRWNTLRALACGLAAGGFAMAA